MVALCLPEPKSTHLPDSSSKAVHPGVQPLWPDIPGSNLLFYPPHPWLFSKQGNLVLTSQIIMLMRLHLHTLSHSFLCSPVIQLFENLTHFYFSRKPSGYSKDVTEKHSLYLPLVTGCISHALVALLPKKIISSWKVRTDLKEIWPPCTLKNISERGTW